MGEDILSVIFLVLVCMVIAGIIHKMVPAQMMIPTFALTAVCLWIALDYILIQRHQAKQLCNRQRVGDGEDDHYGNSESSDADVNKKIKQLTAELELTDETSHGTVGETSDTNIEKKSTETAEKKSTENKKLKPEAKHKNEFDIALYDRQLPTQELFKDSGCAGDTRLANRMKYMGLQPRMSQDIRAKWNAEKFRPYFEEELRDGENRDWWDTDAEYLDALM